MPYVRVLLADDSLTKSWPDGIDWTVTLCYLALAFGLPLVGYICMVLDIRAYLRSLRRAIMVITGYQTDLPEWVRKNTPRCILALGLTMPCTAEEILAAYRRKVKLLHPDRGGDRREFLRLQAQFEEAMAFVAGD
ncbi:MAG TPA: J domain-containing protein [Lacipirellulaceae bacterium]